ncbi:MAG TPA: site-2 protease family protein [Thermoanaerobaculia bacterium]|nr:site-2 protease family protein [Thermoanaerobaculia bacterium]HQR67352.1 site-2 protease family protein [Thermoanaerobaculia bacterium]
MSPEKVVDIVVQIAVLLFAVSFHESAHGWMALRCGDTTARDLGRITLNPLKHLDPVGSLLFPVLLAFSGLPVFGWARPVPVSLRGVPNPRRANLLISAIGPVANLSLAVVAALVLKGLVTTGAQRGNGLVEIAVAALFVNVSLGVFNLIPIPPLDGFGVVESVCPARFYPAIYWLRRYGFVILFVAMFTGALRMIMIPVSHLVLRGLLWILP